MNKLQLILLILGASQQVLAQDIPVAPPCAQACLANATSAQEVCMGLNVKCLCANSDFMSSLYCCLSTTCSPPDQQKGIDFNVASCGAVNESAPAFVGCAPLADPSDTETSTVVGAIEPALTKFDGDVPATATFDGRKSLLTGTCTDAHYAQVTAPGGETLQFPEIGCSERLGDCCPFDPHRNAVLTACPQDYVTTTGACCPSGWQVYFTDIGGQTPCYTRPTITYVPEKTPTASGFSLVTGRLFARKFDLADSAAEGSAGLSSGGIAGIVIGVIALLALAGAFVVFFLRRRRAAREAASSASGKPASSHFSSGEMAVVSPTSITHELASPQTVPPSPSSPGSVWIASSGTSPRQYEYGGKSSADHQQSRHAKPAQGVAPAQELPGSTFIFEHHPAYSPATSRPESDATAATAPGAIRNTTAPSSPPRTPGKTTPRSSPPVSLSANSKPNVSPVTVSPLASPKRL